MQLNVVTEEFLSKYNKSAQEGYDNYSLIDCSQIKPDKKDYQDFNKYINDLCDYMGRKFRYTYGSKEKKKT